MALSSTHQLSHSLPNRSPSARPIPIPLSEYQPIPFDRHVSQALYRQSLLVPESSSSSRYSGASLPPSHQIETSSHSSTLSQRIDSGDAVGSYRPLRNSAYLAKESGDEVHPPSDEMDIVERGRKGKGRALPPVPHNVPVPDPPMPDYKPQIPPTLTAPSASFAYASLSLPPPNLPPRPQRSKSLPRHYTPTYPYPQTKLNLSMSLPSSQTSQPPPLASGSSVTHRGVSAEKTVSLLAKGKTPIWSTHYFDPLLHDPLFHIPHQVTNVANIALTSLASGPKTKFNQTIGAPIDGLAKMAKDWVVPPDGVFETENGAMELGLGVIDSGVKGWGKEKGRKKARVQVNTKSGGIKVDLMTIDLNRQIDLRVESKSGDVLIFLPETFFGPVHITSPSPPILLDILQPQCAPLANPYSSFYTTQVVPLVLPPLPSPSPLTPGPNLSNSLSPNSISVKAPPPLTHTQSTTTVSLQPPPRIDSSVLGTSSSIHSQGDSNPILLRPPPRRPKNTSFEHKAARNIERYVPSTLRENSDILDQVVGGYGAHGREEQSKIVVKTQGRVVLGYRDSKDERQVEELGLKVGVEREINKKKKRWWG
ncbi:hypothetical protein M231_02512 [Tremella mesenterica]|uniref:DUF7330 domain-containing protein n=1 Tax=Tremella mesenterica TaxID=5217 RepID=A0A4Q1BQM4_TREME|nr:hypothetical protein M231_02512 [Tremella mesenterica]